LGDDPDLLIQGSGGKSRAKQWKLRSSCQSVGHGAWRVDLLVVQGVRIHELHQHLPTGRELVAELLIKTHALNTLEEAASVAPSAVSAFPRQPYMRSNGCRISTTMRREIPGPLIGVVSEIVARRESHATLDSLFMYAGAPGEPPEMSKQSKAQEWLRRTNREKSVDPLGVLGRVLENYMETVVDPSDPRAESFDHDKEKLVALLSQFELQYVRGGKVTGALAAPSRTLEELIRDRDLASINEEFDRALSNVATNHREAVSAASNILEAVCKVYIEDEALPPPTKLDLPSVWNVVRKHLGFDPAAVQDRDLQQILTGLSAVVSGIGALRTHASSAHGSGRRPYKLQARHARLAVHAAHTLALFVLETWDLRRQPA
jgi:Abortive infection C-terminus